MSTSNKNTIIPLQQPNTTTSNTSSSSSSLLASKANPQQITNNTLLNLSATPFIPVGLRDKKNTTENDNNTHQKFYTGMYVGNYGPMYTNHMIHTDRGSYGKIEQKGEFKGSNVQGKTMLSVDAKPFFAAKKNDKEKIVLKANAPVFKPKYVKEKEEREKMERENKEKEMKKEKERKEKENKENKEKEIKTFESKEKEQSKVKENNSVINNSSNVTSQKENDNNTQNELKDTHTQITKTPNETPHTETNITHNNTEQPPLTKEPLNTPSQPLINSNPTPPRTIQRNYFLIPQSPLPSYPTSFPYDYLLSFSTWQICKETTLLPNSVLSHFTSLKTTFTDNTSQPSPFPRSHLSSSRNKEPSSNSAKPYHHSFLRGSFTPEIPIESPSSMQKWGRKDISNELEMAAKYKQKIEELKQKDPLKFDLRELLNMLAVDNYDDTKAQIFNKIKDDVEHQRKFLDVLFKKAVHEKAFVNLYAKLCKEFDKELTQRKEASTTTTTTSSVLSPKKKMPSKMRSILLDKCREIFKIENNQKLDNYINITDIDEREAKIKKFILGNVNFIGELINYQVISKKIVFQCIDNLFNRYENGNDSLLKHIHIEAIVILTDKFGTLMNKSKQKIKTEDWNEFTKKIEMCLNKLNNIQNNSDNNLKGYLKYKIINLIEKSKNNWEETQFEKNISAKGKDEIRKQFEMSQSINNNNKYSQSELNNKIRNDLISFKDFLDEGNKLSQYEWEIITDLYKKNNLSEIVESFIENCIDFIINEKTLRYANDYVSEVINFYAPHLTDDEMNKLQDTTIDIVSQVYYLQMDNQLMLDLISNVLVIMNSTGIMNYKHLREVKMSNEYEYKCLFELFYKVSKSDVTVLNEVEKMSCVIDNRQLYNEVIHI